MINDKILNKITSYFPNVKLKFKNESLLMKILGFLMFWNKDFMTQYSTTIGDTIYFPSKSFIDTRPISSTVVLLHELVHIYDKSRLTSFLFSFLYLFPQILFLLFPILLLFSWKIAIIFLIFSLPIPAYFRMIFEKRAYFASLYIMNFLNNKYNFKIDLAGQVYFYVEQFKNSSYYFMWPFSSISKKFDDALIKINNGDRPFDDKAFDLLDDILKDV